MGQKKKEETSQVGQPIPVLISFVEVYSPWTPFKTNVVNRSWMQLCNSFTIECERELGEFELSSDCVESMNTKTIGTFSRDI